MPISSGQSGVCMQPSTTTHGGSSSVFCSSPVAKFAPTRSFLSLARQVLYIAVGTGNFAALPDHQSVGNVSRCTCANCGRLYEKQTCTVFAWAVGLNHAR